jgi:hypothetical protein
MSYVVPGWARTTTATKPCISVEVTHSQRSGRMYARRPRHSSASGRTGASLANNVHRAVAFGPPSASIRPRLDILLARTGVTPSPSKGTSVLYAYLLHRIRRCTARPLTPHGMATQLAPLVHCSRPTMAQTKMRRARSWLSKPMVILADPE